MPSFEIGRACSQGELAIGSDFGQENNQTMSIPSMKRRAISRFVASSRCCDCLSVSLSVFSFPVTRRSRAPVPATLPRFPFPSHVVRSLAFPGHSSAAKCAVAHLVTRPDLDFAAAPADYRELLSREFISHYG